MNTLKHIVILSVLFFSACATHQLPTESTTSQPSTTQQPLENKTKKQATTLSSWEISGAMAARNKKKGWSASLNWVQKGLNQYQIRLNGPLGGGAVIIEKKNGLVTYADGPKKISSSNADALLLQQTDIRLPVNNLYYWVRGLPAPGAITASTFDQQHHLSSLNQAGYLIHYSNYTTVNQVDLPSKILLEGHGVVIKLIIKHWRY